jgi:hypothetical protein
VTKREKKVEKEEEDPVEHGIDSAYYTWVGPGMLWPHLICTCKNVCRGPTWEDAGAQFDVHLAKTRTTS